MSMTKPVNIFVCHDPADLSSFTMLKKHLSLPLRQKSIIIWHDGDISAGAEWEFDLEQYLNTAQIILLFISSDFIASANCHNMMEKALILHESGEAKVISIILRSIMWDEDVVFKHLPFLPSDGNPIIRKSSIAQDRVWSQVAKGIREVVNEINVMPGNANILFDKRCYKEALEVYEKFLLLRSDDARAYLGKGRTLLALECYKEGLEALTKAEEDSDIVDAQFYRDKASALRKMKENGESLTAYDKALAFCSDALGDQLSIAIQKEKGEVLILLHRYRDAVEVYKQIIFHAPNDAEQYQRLGDAHVKLNNYQLVIEVYDHAIQLNPDDVQCYEKKGDLLLSMGRDEDALVAYDKILHLLPNEVRYLKKKGAILFHLELYEEAHTVYGDCIRLVVDDPYCHYGKGLALFRLNRYKEALVAYEEAIRLSEPKPDPQFYYGKVLVYERLVQEDYERERQACLDWNPNRENNLSALLLVSPEAFTLHNLTKHTDEIWQLAFSPDSKFLASLSKDRTIKLWDPRTGDFLYSLELPDEIWKLTFSPNGKFLASRGKDHTIRLWDPRTGDLLHDHLIGHTDDIWELVFSLDSKFLASRSMDHTIRLWDPRTGELLYPLPHTDAVWELVFSPDSKFLASRSQDHTIRLWDIHTGTEELLYPLERTDDVYQLAFSPDSKLLASRSQDRALRLWDTHTRKLLHTLEHTSDIRDFAFSPDGHYLASCSAGRRINFWNPWTGEHLRTLQESIENPWHLVFSPDGQRLANCGDNQIELWDPQSQADKPLYSLSESAGGLQSRCPVFSPDGHYLASQSKDETIRLWNSYTGDLVRVLTGHVGKISGFTFSPNGHYLASWSEDKTIKLWSMPNKNM